MENSFFNNLKLFEWFHSILCWLLKSGKQNLLKLVSAAFIGRLFYDAMYDASGIV